MIHRPVCLVMLGGLALFGGEVFAQTPCDALANVQLPHTTITSATMVAAGPLSNAQRINVPAHCEVKGVTRPTKDSEIQFAVWLPPAGWNGKYLRLGTVVGPAPLDIRPWSIPSFAAMRSPERMTVIRAAAGLHGLSVIRKS
jgi:hypothetical protein